MSSFIHLTSPAIDSKAWTLKVVEPGSKSKYLVARVEGLVDNQAVSDFLLMKMEVKVVSTSGELLEKATFHSQVKERNGGNLLYLSHPVCTKACKEMLSEIEATLL